MDNLKAKLKEELGSAPFDELKPHMDRDALIWVCDTLDLVDVAFAFAEDQKDLVAGWLENGSITKFDKAQQEALEIHADSKIDFLIVQPFVLFQSVNRDLLH